MLWEAFPCMTLALASLRAALLSSPATQQQGVPVQPNDVKTLVSSKNITIRYKEPGSEGVCETSSGVKSYSGYVDLDDDTHMFFWFFEARTRPEEAPITLWLNGGPGADSLIGLFEEIGPCQVLADGTTRINSFSFNEVSNLLFLSQPIGTGFSYQNKVVGIRNQTTGLPQPSDQPDGRYGNADPYRYDTTDRAAVTAWEVLQAFLETLPSIDPNVKSRSLNLWAESYGGHWGPTFFKYFYDQNILIRDGSAQGIEIEPHTLGIINGLISERIQMPQYPEFAYNNTYGIEGINKTIYNFTKMALSLPGGCLDSLDWCARVDRSDRQGQSVCDEATALCRKLVEGPFERLAGRSVYDIRVPKGTGLPTDHWVHYVNTASVQNALGVDLNYTSSQSIQVLKGFYPTGDHAYPNSLQDLETLLNLGIRVALVYGDADYICNWYGGEAVSLAANYAQAPEFRRIEYAPFVVDGIEFGLSRQFGNFSFTRIYEAGHEVPYYQPKASLELFRRVLEGLMISDGNVLVAPT